VDDYTTKKNQNQAMIKFAKTKVTAKMLDRIKYCGGWLHFIADKPMEKRKLMNSNFCKWRFCPMCGWRKALSDSLMISLMMKQIHTVQRKAFIFLTLTVPNVPATKLKAEITELNKAFDRLFKSGQPDEICHGYLRKLEVTYNPTRDDYHPHFHVVIAVNQSYFRSRDYIKQAKWLELWRRAKRDPSITQVDVRKVQSRKDATGAIESFEVAEFSKYAAKDADYAKNKKVFDTFYDALKGRRQMTFGGLFTDAHMMYEDGELDHYLTPDMAQYYWDLRYKWQKESYDDGRKSKLTGLDRLLLERKGLQVDSEIPRSFIDKLKTREDIEAASSAVSEIAVTKNKTVSQLLDEQLTLQ
jgi:plasmid rolling circle replication initiator protein Rep